MKNIRKILSDNLWMSFPAVLLILFGVCVCYLYIPLGRLTVAEGSNLLRHYGKIRDASSFPMKEKRLRGEIALLDSVIKKLDGRNHNLGGKLVDELYILADSAGFKTGKVESGVPQPVEGCRETAITIEGTGTYRSTGFFIEKIENSHQPTRIRQLIVKARENGDPEVFIDLTVRER